MSRIERLDGLRHGYKATIQDDISVGKLGDCGNSSAYGFHQVE